MVPDRVLAARRHQRRESRHEVRTTGLPVGDQVTITAVGATADEETQPTAEPLDPPDTDPPDTDG